MKSSFIFDDIYNNIIVNSVANWKTYNHNRLPCYFILNIRNVYHWLRIIAPKHENDAIFFKILTQRQSV